MQALSTKQLKLQEQVTNPFKFALFLLQKLPMGWIAGIRVRKLDHHSCTTSVPFKFLNQNPFRSTYFAVQAMAAELSTAMPCLLAVTGHSPSIALIVVETKATFHKKAISKAFFTCENGDEAFLAVEHAVTTGQASTATLRTVGKMQDGTVVASFEFTWSFKQRSK